MPRAKKTTEDTAKATSPKATAPKATKPTATKSSKTSKATTTTTARKTSGPALKVAELEQRLNETEAKLNSLISVIHSDLDRGQRTGPEGLAAKLRKAGLLS